jgi:hypothetical protein
MHLVFATSIVPAGEPRTGYEIANAAIIGALRRAGVRVTVIGYIWPGQTPTDPEQTVVLGEIDVRTDTASALRKVGWLLQAVPQGLTFASVKLRASGPDAVRQALRKIEPYDGYVVNAVQMAGAFEMLFHDRPSIFVAHNVEYRSAEENAAAATSALQRLLYSREARLLRQFESRLCQRSDFIWTLAEEDRVMLGIDKPSLSAALPMVVAQSEPAAPRPRQPQFDAALIGTWTWQPNRIGLDWFLNDVVPHLPEDFSVHIAGNAGGQIDCPHPGVKFVGFVPDATEFLRQSRVIPLISRAGTGVQLKTIETFELGLPAVATSSSLRGIAERPSNCVVADDPRAFAEALVRAAKTAMPDLDGRGFYCAQRAKLDLLVAEGVERLGQARSGVAA